MAKGAYLTPRIKKLVAKIYLENHRQIGPTKAREELLEKMRGEGLDKIFGPDFPGVSSVSKLLKEYDERYEGQSPELKELDKPWSTISMSKYPIPPEALPAVLQLWVWTRENLDIEFTIREAQWVARLYAVTKNIPILSFISRAYAATEMICEQIGASYESRHSLDLKMFGLMTGQEITPERQEKILGEGEEEWFLGLSDEEWSDMQQTLEQSGLNGSVRFELIKVIEPSKKQGGTK